MLRLVEGDVECCRRFGGGGVRLDEVTLEMDGDLTELSGDRCGAGVHLGEVDLDVARVVSEASDLPDLLAG